MVQLRSQKSEILSDCDEGTSSILTPRTGPPKSDSCFNRKLMLAKEGTINITSKAQVLPHPRSKASTLYYGVGSEDTLCEIVKIGQGKRSFFLGESVVSDGDVVAFIPINPLFLVLPHLIEHATGKSVPLDQILTDDMLLLMKNATLLKALKKVTDWTEVCDTTVYRHNEDKMFVWLEKKYKTIQEHIKTKKLVSQIVMDDDDAFKRVSFQLLEEYLPDTISEKAKKHFRIKELEVAPNTNKRPAVVDDMTEFATTVKGPPKKQPAKISTAQKQLKQASKGTKSLMSFFGAKAPSKK
uniref:RNase_H2-Ydr279 domain-containing protein n=1 Tax=Steinernema glaseri TaxID=37863 RepID=A0A1I7ZHB6_9BILA